MGGLLAAALVLLLGLGAGGNLLREPEFCAAQLLQSRLPGLLPLFAFVQEGGGASEPLFYRLLEQQLPFFCYARENGFLMRPESEADRLKLLRLPEEGQAEALPVDESRESALLEENRRAKEQQEAQAQEEAAQEAETPQPETERTERRFVYSLEDYQDYESLMKEFYAVDPTTAADESLFQLDALLGRDMTLREEEGDGPQILIYHTHSQEGFADSVPGDESTTVVGVGERLTQLLEEKGFRVLHDRGVYDRKRDYAYANAAPALEQILAENPDIQVIIDLHRDEVPEDTHLAADLDGRPVARLMFFNGLSRTRKTGVIESLENPYLQDNLAFAFQMQLACNEYYPGLTRRIYLKGYRYNMHYCPKTLLVELGAQTNTVEEALGACEPLADVLEKVLRGKA